MAKKIFAVNESKKLAFVTMPQEDVKKYLKNDGYDHLREKVYHSKIKESEFENGLKDVEKTILKLKSRKEAKDIKTTMNPLEDRVLIFQDEAELMTGGLYIPEQQQKAPARGTIVKAGPGLPGKVHQTLVGYMVNGVLKSELGADETGEPLYKLTGMPVKEGDRVLYSKQAGLLIQDPKTKTEFLVMRITDVWIQL